MHFLNPSALWLLPAAVIPFLLARRRPTAPRRVVSNLYLWRDEVRLDGVTVAPRRARTSWSIVLQVLCIIAIVGVLAGTQITTAAQRATVIVDVSASMGARDGASPRIEQARRRAADAIARLGGNGLVRVIAAGATPSIVGDFAAGDAGLRNALAGLTPTAGTADLTAAVGLAVSRPDSGAVIVLSDAAPPDAPPAAQEVRWEHIGSPAANMAISRLAVRPRALGSEDGDVLVELRNFSGAARAVAVTVSSEAGASRQKLVQVDGGGSAAITVRLSPLGRFVSARLAPGDALEADDVRVAIVPQATTIRTLLVGSRGSYLEQALAANPSVSVETVPSTTVATDRLRAGDVDVVVCDGCPSAPPGAPAALLVFPRATSSQPALLTVSPAPHRITEGLERVSTTAVRVSAAPVHPEATVLMRAGALPSVTAYDDGTQRVVDIRADVAAGALPLSAGFPVLIANSIEWLAAAAFLPADVASGEAVRVPARGSRANIAPSMVVTGPDGRERRTTVSGADVVVTDTGTAGVYRMRHGASEQLFAVNAAVDEESNLMATAPSPASGNAAEGGAGIQLEAQSAIAPILAIVALLLLAAEWGLNMVTAR